ncbi:hypothetical protein [Hasllibacter sp. MH4015]|uniref:hypothetical protein n=1 Tax=Hasllibacter sp. MH4015 TaxID=2854029 RepID=UPI001CD312C4|nr:hypothetical protein [Hasllibacter sp. MH4015]
MSTAADRAALHARQGAGARYDARAAPHDDLLFARRATANFSRLLSALPDDLLVDKRARVVASVGYDARHMAHLVAAARTGQPVPAEAEMRHAASLPPRALRGLYDHAAKHLDVEWRDLPDAGWEETVARPGGAMVAVRATPRIRAITLWQAAMALDAGGRARDVPPSLRAEASLEG